MKRSNTTSEFFSNQYLTRQTAAVKFTVFYRVRNIPKDKRVSWYTAASIFEITQQFGMPWKLRFLNLLRYLHKIWTTNIQIIYAFVHPKKLLSL